MGLAVQATVIVSPAWSQPPDLGHPGAMVILSPANSTQPDRLPDSDLVREIRDPHTGDRWLLMRDPSRPGGPGRMVLASIGGASKPAAADLKVKAVLQAEKHLPLPVIHTGDRLIVEENTPVVEARLEAVALGSALPGLPLKVRLVIGGRIVRTLALAPGHAALAQESGWRP